MECSNTICTLGMFGINTEGRERKRPRTSATTPYHAWASYSLARLLQHAVRSCIEKRSSQYVAPSLKLQTNKGKKISGLQHFSRFILKLDPTTRSPSAPQMNCKMPCLDGSLRTETSQPTDLSIKIPMVSHGEEKWT